MSKLILTQEVSGLGSAGDIVEVKGGYARNYLLPHGFAVTYSKGGAKQVEQLRAARTARELATLEDAQALKAKLEASKLRVVVKAGGAGRLFGAVKPADVAQAAAEAGVGQIDKRKVVFPQPIKAVGDHAVTVRLHDEVIAEVTLQVIAAK